MTDDPVLHFRCTYHVGTMNPADKRPDSMEGAGLSVSDHPSEWRQIAKGLVNGPTWKVRRADNGHGQFLNAHRMTRQSVRSMWLWGQNLGFVAPAPLWRTSWIDGETGTRFYYDHTTRQAAKDDVEFYEGRYRKISGFVATDKLRLATNNKCETSTTRDMLMTVYAEAKGLDGVWWTDRYDPLNLSCPRGVIVPGALRRWAFTKLDDEHHAA